MAKELKLFTKSCDFISYSSLLYSQEGGKKTFCQFTFTAANSQKSTNYTHTVFLEKKQKKNFF